MPAMNETDRASHVLLPQKIKALDEAAIASGAPLVDLVDRAAAECVRVIRGRYARGPVTVVAGPGLNGADGFSIAHELSLLGWPVALSAALPPEQMEGAAGEVARRTGLAVSTLREAEFGADRLVIDALFGAGLCRELVGVFREVVERIGSSESPVVAIDLPSGVSGATGEVMGAAAPADATVTFHAPKPGHLLNPGRGLCGELFVRDIGLPSEAAPDALRNGPALWALPRPAGDSHKYERGHVLVFGGPHGSSGAARLSAHGAVAAGAGAVTIASPVSALDVNASRLDAIMVRPASNAEEARSLINDTKAKAIVLGPGAGRTDQLRSKVLAALEARLPTVLDADALTSFEDEAETLLSALHEKTVLTPHEGEFARLFPRLTSDKLARAQAAADRCGATVLLKGGSTVVTTRDRAATINTHAAPWLATAGSGDVLAGVIAALMAQGMTPHDAACAGAWLHGDAGIRGGARTNADRLPELVSEAYASAL